MLCGDAGSSLEFLPGSPGGGAAGRAEGQAAGSGLCARGGNTPLAPCVGRDCLLVGHVGPAPGRGSLEGGLPGPQDTRRPGRGQEAESPAEPVSHSEPRVLVLYPWEGPSPGIGVARNAFWPRERSANAAVGHLGLGGEKLGPMTLFPGELRGRTL